MLYLQELSWNQGFWTKFLYVLYVNQSQNVAADDGKNDDNNVKSLACSNNICAIVADKSWVDTVWFLLIIDSNYYNHTEESRDG